MDDVFHFKSQAGISMVLYHALVTIQRKNAMCTAPIRLLGLEITIGLRSINTTRSSPESLSDFARSL